MAATFVGPLAIRSSGPPLSPQHLEYRCNVHRSHLPSLAKTERTRLAKLQTRQHSLSRDVRHDLPYCIPSCSLSPMQPPVPSSHPSRPNPLRRKGRSSPVSSRTPSPAAVTSSGTARSFPAPGGVRLAAPQDRQRASPSLSARLSELTFGYELPCRAAGASLSVPGAKWPCATCPVRYRCPRGHVITAHADSPASKQCPRCDMEQSVPATNPSRARLSLHALRAIAEERGGTCEALTYENARTPVQWRCKHGHVWLASADNVKSRGSWCPTCARARHALTIADMHAMAARLGGKCLEKEYVSVRKKMKWECAHGHRFDVAPNNVRRSEKSSRKPTWCPVCKRESKRSKAVVLTGLASRNGAPVPGTGVVV